VTRAKVVDKIVTAVLYLIAALIVVLLATIMVYLLYQGVRAASPALLSFSGNGVGIQLFNTVYLVFLSLLITVPIGICAGIYLAEYAGKGPVIAVVRTCIETLSSLPSIIVGLFGFLVLIQLTHSQWNLLAGAASLAIINIPLIARTTEDALRATSRACYDGSIGLGATRWQTVARVQMRASIPRIITGVILAAGRGFGEAAVLIYTSGMNSDINFSNWNPASITSPLNVLRPADTLAVHIWALKTESILPNATQIANLSAAVLVVLVLVFSLLARWLGRRLDRQMLGER